MPLRTLFVCTLLLANVSVSAEEVPQVPVQLLKFLSSNDEICTKTVPQFIVEANLQIALKERQVDVASICSCVHQSILADKKLLEEFDAEKEVLLERFKEGHLSSYLILRSTQSAFICIAKDLEKSIAVAKVAH